MALTKCPECKKEVSTLATICPHCGAPVETNEVKEEKTTAVEQPTTEPVTEVSSTSTTKSSNKGLMIIGVIIIVLLAALIVMKTQEIGFFSSDNTSSKEEKDDEDESYKEKNPDDLDQIEVVKKSIIVREEPDSESEKLGKIYKGDIYNIRDIIYIDETDEIAYEIEFEDESGYIVTSRDESEVEILLNDTVYDDVEEIFNPELTKQEKDELIVQALLDNGFFESTETENLYILGNTTDTTSTSIMTYNFNDDTFNFYFQSGESYMFLSYYFLEDRVEYMYMSEGNSDSYMYYTYNTRTKTGTCKDELNGLLCNEVDLEGTIDPLIEQTIEMLETILDSADLKISDLE